MLIRNPNCRTGWVKMLNVNRTSLGETLAKCILHFWVLAQNEPNIKPTIKEQLLQIQFSCVKLTNTSYFMFSSSIRSPYPRLTSHFFANSNIRGMRCIWIHVLLKWRQAFLWSTLLAIIRNSFYSILMSWAPAIRIRSRWSSSRESLWNRWFHPVQSIARSLWQCIDVFNFMKPPIYHRNWNVEKRQFCYPFGRLSRK